MDRLACLSAAAQAFIDDGQLAGAVTVVARRGRIAHLETHGMMDIEANKPMQKDTIFRIYSMTKPIAAATDQIVLFPFDDYSIPFQHGVRLQLVPYRAGVERKRNDSHPTQFYGDSSRRPESLRHLCGKSTGLLISISSSAKIQRTMEGKL